MKRIFELFGILLFVWLSMLLGLWLIFRFVVPLTLPIGGWLGRFLTGCARTGVSAVLAVSWLWVWRKIAYTCFWRRSKVVK